MVIALLAAAAFGREPPRMEVLAGWSGNAHHGYGFVAVQPALLRTIDASLTFRATASRLHYASIDNDGRVVHTDGPGLVVGPAFVYSPGDFSLALGVGVGFRQSRHTWLSAPDVPAIVEVRPDATFSGDAYFRPGQHAQLFCSFSFSAADPYLWGRVGGAHPVLPMFRENPPVALWLGLEGTGSGAFRANETGAYDAGRAFSVGPLAEVPIRDLRTVLAARAGLELGSTTGLSIGFGAYWAWR